MRQIYSSARLENIERMVALLREHGIETRVTELPVYRRASYDRPSFRDRDADNWPKVWLAHADDLPRARELLRGMGIDPEPGRRIGELVFSDTRAARGRRAIGRVRLLLLAVIAALLLGMLLRALGWM